MDDKMVIDFGWTKSRIFRIVIVLALIGIIGAGAFYFFQNYQKYSRIAKDPDLAEQEKIKLLESSVSKLIKLPSGQRQIATVVDKKRLNTSDFFKSFFEQSQNGDQVLIISRENEQYWYLYRPTSNLLINFSKASLEEQVPKEEAAQEKLEIVVLNGSSKTGFGAEMGKKIQTEFQEARILAVSNANKADYEQSLVVDLTGKNKELASRLSTFLDAKISTLPKDEQKPKADILIIVAE